MLTAASQDNCQSSHLSYDQLSIREQDAIRLIIEFLDRRDLSISQLALERESGIYNCDFSDDLIFLRQLILDGQWSDVLQFVSPLQSLESFNWKQFKYIIYKHKYVELLCIRSEACGATGETVEVGVHDIIECLTILEDCCVERDEYNRLSSLLTLTNLADDEQLKKWNPNSWRLKCFNDVRSLVEKFMQADHASGKKIDQIARNDRLVNLIFKGLMYEVCISGVKQKVGLHDGFNLNVMNGIEDQFSLINLIHTLPNKWITEYLESVDDSRLLSGASKVDRKTTLAHNAHFSNIEKHDRPELVASWSEMIMSTPIKPNVFPHTKVPYTRIRTSDLMSKSLSASLMNAVGHETGTNLMAMSVCDIAQFSRSMLDATGFRLSEQPVLEEEYDMPSDGSDPEHTFICDNETSNEVNQHSNMVASVDRLFQSTSVFSSSNRNDEVSAIPSDSTPLSPIAPSSSTSSVNKMPTIVESSVEVVAPIASVVDNTGPMNVSYIDMWTDYHNNRTNNSGRNNRVGTGRAQNGLASAERPSNFDTLIPSKNSPSPLNSKVNSSLPSKTRATSNKVNRFRSMSFNHKKQQVDVSSPTSDLSSPAISVSRSNSARNSSGSFQTASEHQKVS